MSHQSVPAGAYNVPAVTFKEVEPTNGKEKSTGSEWPQEAPYEEHYMTKSPIKQDRPFSEQKNLAPTVSVPPQYGNEHEAARDDAIARSEHIEDTKETNLLDPTVKDTRRRRLRRHCARYIICYCLGLLILLAILLPIMYVPKRPNRKRSLTRVKIPRHLPNHRTSNSQQTGTPALGSLTSRADSGLSNF